MKYIAKVNNTYKTVMIGEREFDFDLIIGKPLDEWFGYDPDDEFVINGKSYDMYDFEDLLDSDELETINDCVLIDKINEFSIKFSYDFDVRDAHEMAGVEIGKIVDLETAKEINHYFDMLGLGCEW